MTKFKTNKFYLIILASIFLWQLSMCRKIFLIWTKQIRAKFGVRVNQRTHFPLTPMYFLPLPACWYHANVTSQANIIIGAESGLAETESSRKYIGISGKWVHCFTRTPKFGSDQKVELKKNTSNLSVKFC